VVALVATEHTLFVAVGVPWLQQQLRQLASDATLSDEERYLVVGLYSHLACGDWIEVFDRFLAATTSPRVIAALLVMAQVLEAVRPLAGSEAKRWEKVQTDLEEKRVRYRAPIKQALQLKDKLMEMEFRRLQRLTKPK